MSTSTPHNIIVFLTHTPSVVGCRPLLLTISLYSLPTHPLLLDVDLYSSQYHCIPYPSLVPRPFPPPPKGLGTRLSLPTHPLLLDIDLYSSQYHCIPYPHTLCCWISTSTPHNIIVFLTHTPSVVGCRPLLLTISLYSLPTHPLLLDVDLYSSQYHCIPYPHTLCCWMSTSTPHNIIVFLTLASFPGLSLLPQKAWERGYPYPHTLCCWMSTSTPHNIIVFLTHTPSVVGYRPLLLTISLYSLPTHPLLLDVDLYSSQYHCIPYPHTLCCWMSTSTPHNIIVFLTHTPSVVGCRPLLLTISLYSLPTHPLLLDVDLYSSQYHCVC